MEDRPPFSPGIQAKINQFEESSKSKFFVTPRVNYKRKEKESPENSSSVSKKEKIKKRKEK